MGILDTAVDHRDPAYLEARTAMLAALGALETALDAARDSGGERAVTRHHARGRLLPRERIELLVDRDSPLLELSPVAGWGSGASVGAAVVTAVGVVEGQLCAIVADDPTVPAGAGGAGTLRKVRRAQQIALENRLPFVSLVEAAMEPVAARQRYGGPRATEPELLRATEPELLRAAQPELLRAAELLDAPGQPEIIHHTGQVVAGYARLAAAQIPTVGVFFGQPSVTAAAGAFDHTIAMAGQVGGLPAPARPTDQLAEDERDALRLARQCARRFPARPASSPAVRVAAAPKHDPEDLLAVPVSEPRETLGRILDGSAFDEIQPGYGEALCTGWGEVHGHPVAVVADADGTARAEETDKAIRFIRLAANAGTPLLFLQHGTAPPAGAAIPAAVAAAGVPLLTVRVGGWHGPAALPALARFRFAWPQAGSTLPPAGPASSAAGSVPAGAGEAGSALALSGWLDDDGVIDPRDTRTVLGLCLSVVRS